VVRNQCLKRWQRNASLVEPKLKATHERSPESQVLNSEIENAIARAVMELPETQREVLILAHYEQMPLADIARVVNLEVGAVKSRLQRARAQLKETLAAYAPGEGRKR
jgi:RNA polymerase sigma-70 factor, ECF subfamily